jgi:Mrp family chromosome partitioning ATPase
VRLALERLRRDGAPLAGVVLSMVDAQARHVIGEGDATFYHSALRRYYKG